MKSSKFFKAILPGIFLPPIIGTTPLIVHIDSEIFGPFTQHESPQPYLSYRVRVNRDLHHAYEEIQAYDKEDKDVIWRMHSMYHDIEADKEFISNLLLPTNDIMRKSGCKLSFVIREDDKIVFIKSFKIYSDQIETIDPTEYSNLECKLLPRRYQFIDGEPYLFSDSFFFDDFYDYFSFDYYYRLNISQYYFRYSENGTLTYSTANLIMPDPQDCFSGLIIKNGEEIKIPLTLYQDEKSNICLKFSSKFYVNKQNLLMSMTKKDGYSQTSHFYFPINKKEEATKQRFIFEITGFGRDKTTLRWETKLLDVPYLIGDCAHSEYCVVGGVKWWAIIC